MRITSDWHIHSHNSCDSACLAVKDLITAAAAQGVTDFGLTDHLYTRATLSDIWTSRQEYLANNPPPRFHFGVEVSVMSQWELEEIASERREDATYGLRSGGPVGAPLAIVLTSEHVEEYGIEYVVGGVHWPMYVPFKREAVIRDYHRQNMFLATHPLVDIVAHPWWWMGHWQDEDGMYRGKPWCDDFGVIPQAMHDEFAAAVREHGKVVEINLNGMLLNQQYPDNFKRQYLNYLAGLKKRGVKLCTGSDCHDAHYGINFERTTAMLASVGITDEELWRLPARRAL